MFKKQSRQGFEVLNRCHYYQMHSIYAFGKLKNKVCDCYASHHAILNKVYMTLTKYDLHFKIFSECNKICFNNGLKELELL